MRKISMIGLVTVLALGAQMASAFDRGPEGRRPDGPRGDRGSKMCEMGGPMMGMGDKMCGMQRLLNNPEAAAAIGLKDEQAAKLKSIRKTFDRSSIQMKADLQIARLDLMDAMQAEPANRDAIYKAMEAVNTAELKLKKAGLDAMLEAKAVLTSDQIAALKEMRPRNRKDDKGQHGRREMKDDDRDHGSKGSKEGCGKKQMPKDCPMQKQDDKKM